MEGVDWAISRCLESDPSEAELEALIRSTPTAQVAHVSLSANVFVAAHRAIAIGIAASETVHVRASRREPEMAELLLTGAPGSFQLLSELSPHSGDRLWAYGSDATLREIAVTLGSGVVLHAHGAGFGVCVIDGRALESEPKDLFARLAEDVALFDQRGCLSLRVVLVEAGPQLARDVARELANELSVLETRVPRGQLTAHELAEIALYRDSVGFAGELFPAGLGFVGLSGDPRWPMPPIGRNVHVLTTGDAQKILASLWPMITSFGFVGSAAQRSALLRLLSGARLCNPGEMQRPPFDGPVDRRDL